MRVDRAGKAVAVFGAAGHTGRFVVAELLRRGLTPIMVGRDVDALERAFPSADALRRQATIDDPASLDRAFAGAAAVINCAGPFLETAHPVAAAALRAGAHYLDVSAEQPSARETLDAHDPTAREAGVAVIPAMGFYGGLGDLLATAAMGDWDRAETIEIAIGLDSWLPTRGTRVTGERNTAQRVIVVGGQLSPASPPSVETPWEFGDQLGRQAVVELPFSEIILMQRHLKVIEARTYLSSVALSDIRNPATPGPQPADATGRSAQRFVVEAVVTRGGERRRMIARGRDIYAFSAPLICEAATRLLDGRYSDIGAHAPGAIFDAADFLAALAPDHLMAERAA